MTGMTTYRDALERFVRESNKIEGITRNPTQGEIDALHDFVELTHPCVSHLQAFVSVVQPYAELRERPHMNVMVGDYYPPSGGAWIREELERLLRDLADHTPYENHLHYEQLHPFTDGNGRSGRALWLWQILNGDDDNPTALYRGFLHSFYYQALEAAQTRA